MKVLLLGYGGREHALGWKMSQSPMLTKLYIAPGNAGTAQVGENVNMGTTDFAAISNFCVDKAIEMVVVGPEEPLVKGITDYLKVSNPSVIVIGPSAAGAQLEGSKDFSKAFMAKYAIPTAGYKTFTAENISEADVFLTTLKPPYVLKADGLAAGKGVLIQDALDEAKRELDLMINSKKFGDASTRVVIEEFLPGIELSVFVLTDGKSYKILPAAKDYKRIGEGDTGLNTGGMGAVSPVPFADAAFLEKVEDRIVKPTITGLASEGIDYKGFIFIGLMNVAGEPFVIEYNVRLGDPETEVVIPRIKSDLLAHFAAFKSQQLQQEVLELDTRFCTTVMMVSGGYPGDYAKGEIMQGLENEFPDSMLFHSGTSQKGANVVTNGGRVLAVSSFGDSIQEALNKSYNAINQVTFEGAYFRKDIGQDVINF